MTVREVREAVKPGVAGRIEAIGQTRDAQGRFRPKLPKPLNDQEFAELAERRLTTKQKGLRFRPTQDEWDLLCREAWYLWQAGHSADTIADALELPETNIRRAIAGGARMEADTAENTHDALEWSAATYATIIDRALAAGDLEEARKATDSLLRARGITTAGGNTGIQVNVKSEGQVSADVHEWLARHDAPARPAIAGAPSD